MSNYFLAKTDPKVYSIDDFAKEKITTWDGVHNFQAINIIKQWQIGDLVLIYHSQGENTIVGIAKVISSPKKNLEDTRPSWVADLELIKIFEPAQRVTLKQIKESGLFADFTLIKQPRLSTMKCPLEFIDWLRTQGLQI